MVTIEFTLPGASPQSLTLDAAPNEKHGATNEVTQYPVETGTNVSDHVRQMPDRLHIEGIVSNSPLPSQVSSSATFEQDMRAGVYADRAEDAYVALLAIQETATLVTVKTELRQYNYMILQSLDVPRSASVGDALQFSADFVQIIMVSTETVELARSPKPTKVKGGTQPKKKVEDAQGRPYTGLWTTANMISGGSLSDQLTGKLSGK